VITSQANPVAATSAAGTGTSAAGNFSVVIGMSAATAQMLGFVLLGFVVLLATTKLASDQLAARRNQKQAGPRPGKSHGAGKKHFRFPRPRRPARPRHWLAAGRPGKETRTGRP
jgi:hypothetical protein